MRIKLFTSYEDLNLFVNQKQGRLLGFGTRFELDSSLWTSRVPTKALLNILPSRCDSAVGDVC